MKEILITIAWVIAGFVVRSLASLVDNPIMLYHFLLFVMGGWISTAGLGIFLRSAMYTGWPWTFPNFPNNDLEKQVKESEHLWGTRTVVEGKSVKWIGLFIIICGLMLFFSGVYL